MVERGCDEGLYSTFSRSSRFWGGTSQKCSPKPRVASGMC